MSDADKNFRNTLNSKGLSSEALQYLRDNNIGGIVQDQQAEEQEPDKEVVVTNPAFNISDENENKQEVDKAFKSAENDITNSGWTKFVEEKINPLRQEIRDQASEGVTTSQALVAGDIAMGALVDNVEDIGNFSIDAANALDEWMQENGYTQSDFVDDDLNLDFSQKLWPELSGTTAESLTRGVAGYLIPLAGFSKLVKGGSAVAKGVKMVGLNAGLSAIKQDPSGENLSNLLQNNSELANPISQYLAIDDSDSDLEARAKSALESVLVDSLALGSAPVLKGLASGGEKLASSMVNKVASVKKSYKATKVAKKIDDISNSIEETMESSNYAKEIELEKLVAVEDEGARVSLINLGEQEDILKGISDIMDELPEIAPRIRTTNEELLNTAVKTIREGDSQEIVRRVAAGTGSEADIAAMELMYEMSLSEMGRLAKKALETGSLADRASAVRSLEMSKMFSALSGKTASDAGAILKLNQFGMQGMEPSIKRKYMANLLNNQSQEGIDSFLSVLSEASDLGADELVKMGDQIVKRSFGSKLFDAAMEVRVNGLLSSGKTQALSVGAALARGPIAMMERGIGALYTTKAAPQDKIFFGEVSEMGKAFWDEGTTQALAGVAGVLDSMKLGHTALKTHRLSQAQKSVAQTQANIADFFSAQGLKRESVSAESFGYGSDTMPGLAIDKFGSVIRIPSWFLARGDQATGMMHYRMQVRSLAYREARAAGLGADETAQLVEELSNAPLDKMRPQHREIAKRIREGAIQESNEARFLNETPGAFKKVNEFMISSAPLRVLMPFHRVDLNIVAQAIDRTPGLAQMTERYRVALEQGGTAAAEAKAKVAMGGAIASIGGMLAFNGILTGEGPKNRDALKMLKANGWQPNSIRIGDKYYNYEKLGEPFNRILKLSATMSEMSGYAFGEHSNPDIQKDYMDLGVALATAIAESGSPEFLNEGFGDIIKAIEQPEGRIAHSIIENIVVGQVPYSSLLRDLRKEVDPFRRATGGDPESPWAGIEEIGNEIKNIIPGMSGNLPPQRNIFGEPQVYPSGVGPDMISPVYRTKFKNDPVINELIRLGVTGPLAHPTPKPGEEHLTMRMPTNIIGVSVAGTSANIQLNAEQYDRLVVLTSNSTGELQGTRGRSLKEALQDVMDKTEGRSDQEKRIMLKKMYNVYKEAAKAQLQKEDPELLEKVKLNALKIEGAFGLGGE